MLTDKARNTINKYRLIDRNDRVLVGVSGGPDSVALLYVLNALSKELGFSLHIAHLDHGLRRDSAKDREFVEGLAERLNIPVTSVYIDVRKRFARGSLEEAARNIRLDFFFSVARKTNADKIALGHNLDDQAETVLMRILRGAGLYGLSGISPKRRIKGCQLIRPLIEVRRSEIEAFLRRKKVKPRIDASNLEDVYLRNRIRNRLLPLLEKEYNANIKEVLSNMAEAAGCDYDYLSGQAERRLRLLGSGKLDLGRLCRLHTALKRMVLRLSIKRLKGDMRRISFRHIREMEDLISGRPVNSIVDLPGGISVIKKKKRLVVYRR